MSDHHHSLATLSFVNGSRHGGKIVLWEEASSDDLSGCNAEGRARADELLRFMDAEGTPFLLGHIVSAIVASGSYGPLETGFFQRITELALAGEMPVEEMPEQPLSRPLLTLVEG